MLYENYQSPWMDEELGMLRDAAGKFFAQEFSPHNDQWIQQGKIDRDAWRQAGDAGLLCAAIPEAYGGGGGDYRHETVIMEEHLRLGITGFGNQVHSAIVAPYLLHYGTEEQKLRWLPGMASGDMVGAIAMTEPNTGSDLQSSPHDSACRWRRIRHQWLKNLHQQRPARRPCHRCRQNRSVSWRQRHIADPGRNRQPGFRTRSQPQETGAESSRHLGNVLQRLPGADR